MKKFFLSIITSFGIAGIASANEIDYSKLKLEGVIYHDPIKHPFERNAIILNDTILFNDRPYTLVDGKFEEITKAHTYPIISVHVEKDSVSLMIKYSADTEYVIVELKD